MTEVCGKFGPPNGWGCGEPRGHAGACVYRPTSEQMLNKMVVTGSYTIIDCYVDPEFFGFGARYGFDYLPPAEKA